MIRISGHYHGINLYVQNPFCAGSVGFCVYEVRVNDTVTTDETSASAFEIDLSRHNLRIGDAVTVTLFHRDECKPKILNPNVLQP